MHVMSASSTPLILSSTDMIDPLGEPRRGILLLTGSGLMEDGGSTYVQAMIMASSREGTR